MHTIYRIAACTLAVTTCFSFIARGDEPAPTLASVPLSGSVQATLDHVETSGTWAMHMNGSFVGEGAKIVNMQLFGLNENGMPPLLSTLPIDMSRAPSSSPFIESFPVPKPDPDWNAAGIELKISDGNNSITVRSVPFPVFWREPVLIDHAVSGSIVTAPNYEHGVVPPGIGIPHVLINGLPEGDYYAVVFFEGMKGCPSDNYVINSFVPDKHWYLDTRPVGYWVKAAGTTAGGCMQEFHVDPAKGDGWFWGPISNTGTSSAIADTSGLPAFAICATAAACDPIIPHTALPTPEDTLGTTTSPVSNVLFLPGIKGNTLYEDNPLCLIPSDGCGIKVWLPLADIAAPELFLDVNGKSRRSLFVREGELLGTAFGQHFYDSFMAFLDNARENGTFGTGWYWKAAAYDWRLSLPDIVHNGAENGSHIYFSKKPVDPYLERTLRSLASSSPTGKVTVVAHSNGGLVAKALMQSLGDTLSAQLIDSVVFVGVPQSGAPRAIGALLYGDAEGIPGIPRVPDVIISAAHAREFGLNSPMAYHLLPSARYMSALQPKHPVVKFEDNNLLAKERIVFGPTIDTEAELQSFTLAKGVVRPMPATNDLNSASILNPSLFTYALDEHAALDAWQPPPGIDVYELGGYGADTISGIDLYQSVHRDGSASLSYRPMFTPDGDGTVPIISALMMNASAQVHHIFLDLIGMYTGPIVYSHANLLEGPGVQETIQSILRRSEILPFTAHAMDILTPSSGAKKKFELFLHSPVSISITDSNGKTTGVSGNGIEENIAGSTAGTLGEVKYVLVPTDNPPYTVALAGEGNGSFTLDLQERENDEVIASSTIADVPVTSSMRAVLSLSTSLAEASPLSLDENGDGTTDFFIPIVLGSTTFPIMDQIPTSTPLHNAEGATSRALSLFTEAQPALVPEIGVPQEVSLIVAKKVLGTIQRPRTQHAAQVTPASFAPHAQDNVLEVEVKHPSLMSRLSGALREALRLAFEFLRMLGVLPKE